MKRLRRHKVTLGVLNTIDYKIEFRTPVVLNRMYAKLLNPLDFPIFALFFFC